MKKILDGKVAFITGAASGIGRGLCKGFAELGSDVVLADINEDGAQEVLSEVEGLGQKGLVVKCDVTDYDSVQSSVEAAVSEFNKIDMLVNNAGYSKLKPIVKLKVGEFQDILKINVIGVYNVTHAMVPHMDKQGGGAIVSTGSTAAIMAMPKWSAYAMSKSSLLAFTRCLGEELKRNKITVNSLMPTMVDTPLLRQGMSDEEIKKLEPMVPADLVPYFAFFGTRKARRMTGVNVNVENIERVLGMMTDLHEEEQKDKISFRDVKDVVKDKMKSSDYRNMAESRRLIDFLFSQR